MSDDEQKIKPKLKPYHKIFLVVLLLAAVGLKLWQYRWPTAAVELAAEELQVLVADTPAHRYRGLGKRDSLGEYDGMLFVFPDYARHGIVMREMRFPIDIIWLNNGEIVDLAPNVPLAPDGSEFFLTVYRPRTEANAVLELKAGWIEAHYVRLGDKLRVRDL